MKQIQVVRIPKNISYQTVVILQVFRYLWSSVSSLTIWRSTTGPHSPQSRTKTEQQPSHSVRMGVEKTEFPLVKTSMESFVRTSQHPVQSWKWRSSGSSEKRCWDTPPQERLIDQHNHAIRKLDAVAESSGCPKSRPVAQKIRDNSVINPSDPLQSNTPKWQQRPVITALISL